MARFDFLPKPYPKDAIEAWDRLVGLVQSMSATVWVRDVELKAGAAGTVVPHGQTTAPKFYSAQPFGASASAAVITKGPIGPRFLTLYTTVDCVCEIEIRV